MTVEEARGLDFVAGQVHSLIGFALAIVNTHPDPAKLHEHVEAADLAAVSVAGGQLVSDDFLKGMEDVAVRLRVSVDTARERRAMPPAESR